MTRLVMALAAAALSASPAAAFKHPKQQAAEQPLPCPEVGTGFVRLPGSATCLKVGGLVRAEAATVKGGR